MQEDGRYKLNLAYNSKKLKVNINVPLKEEQKQETEQVQQSVEADRTYVIQVGTDAAKSRPTFLTTLVHAGILGSHHEGPQAHEAQ